MSKICSCIDHPWSDLLFQNPISLWSALSKPQLSLRSAQGFHQSRRGRTAISRSDLLLSNFFSVIVLSLSRSSFWFWCFIVCVEGYRYRHVKATNQIYSSLLARICSYLLRSTPPRSRYKLSKVQPLLRSAPPQSPISDLISPKVDLFLLQNFH